MNKTALYKDFRCNSFIKCNNKSFRESYVNLVIVKMAVPRTDQSMTVNQFDINYWQIQKLDVSEKTSYTVYSELVTDLGLTEINDH